MKDGQVNSFDPFQILEIDHGSDIKFIKKAYRNLSLKYHPDKNPGNRAAEAKFMMVAKAYEALTDPIAKENYEKYGNPDGKQSLEVSIGLPEFFLDTNNRNLVLMVYLVMMVGVVPFAVWTYYSDSSKYGEKDVMYDTYAWYHHTLSEHTLLKHMPEVMAGSAEFRKRNLPTTSQEKQAIGQLTTQVKTQMLKPKYNHPVCVKGNILLHIHLLRKTNLLSDKDASDLKYMLQLSTSLLDAMISVCKHQDALQTAINCIEFGQHITQATWTKDSPLLQIPHFTAEEVKFCETGKNVARTVQAYKDIPDDQKSGLVNFTQVQKKDVLNFCQIFPTITVSSKVFVDDDEDDKVYEGDLCTIQVTINRTNLKEGEKAGLVHSPLFPFPKKEAFWVILGQLKEGKIISIDKVGNPNQKIIHNIKFLAPPTGTYEFDLFVKSNAYVGIDTKLRVELITLDNSVLPEYKIHPEDAELDDEPTLFEEMLNAHIERDSDDEDNDDDDDDDDNDDDDNADNKDKKKKQQQQESTNDDDVVRDQANKKRAQLRKARQQGSGDDDDDDDSDNAEEVYAEK